MNTIKTILTVFLIAVVMLLWISCKKASSTQEKTNTEKILGKWNWISEVVNNYYGGASHITTYPFPTGDYMEFKTGGKVTEYQSGSTMVYDYGFIDESNIWLLNSSNIYHLNTLTGTDLQLYKKEVTGPDYYESTLNWKK
jgi:hypothetical protein